MRSFRTSVLLVMASGLWWVSLKWPLPATIGLSDGVDWDLDFDFDLACDLGSSLARSSRLWFRGLLPWVGDRLSDDDLRRARPCILDVGERDLSAEESLVRILSRLLSGDSFRLLECLASVFGEGERLRSGDRRVCRGLRRRGGVLDLERDLVSDLGRLRLGGLRDGDREPRWD